ncbi:MAG: hypothetical protein SF162_06400 [bacterium]|nr:hypothetical protein [bacterium]
MTLNRHRIGVLLGMMLMLAACSPAVAPLPTPIPTLPADQIVKRLATVSIPPTLDPGAAAATQRAGQPTPTPTLPPTATPSPYIGVFIGGAAGGNDVPDVDVTLYAGTLAAASAPITFPTLGSPCFIAPDPLYGTEWAAVTERLGCPGEPVTSYIGGLVFFERGLVYSLPTGELYAIATGAQANAAYWYAPAPPPDQGWEITAPAGLIPPSGVYGALWRAVEPVRQALGFARSEPQPVSVSLQRFDRGALLLDSSAGQVFALVGTTGGQIGDGTAFGPYTGAVGSGG